MLRILIAVWFLVAFIPAEAQYSNGRLKCHGEMPDEFKRDYQTSYQKVMDETQVESGREAKKEKKKFSALAAYEVNRLLQSGKVVYGDSISSFCNQVLNILLANQKELRSQLKVFTIRSSEVNAFSTHQGILFVTSGLVAKTQSEAELAFVLAHEVAHFVKKHQLEVFRYSEEIFNSDFRHIHSTEFEKTLKTLKYNKQAEYEADEYGLQLFLAAGYLPKAAPDVLDRIRRVSRAPVDYMMNFNSLQDSFFKIEVPEFNLDSSLKRPEPAMNMEESTHPNAERRIEKLKAKFEKDSLKGGSRFYTESAFLEVRKQALFDLVHTHLVEGDYVAALMLCDALLEDDTPERENLLISRSMALYGLQMLSNRIVVLNQSFYTTEDFRSGTQESYYVFFENITKAQMNLIAARETWKAYQEFSGNPVLKRVLNEVLSSLLKEEVLMKLGNEYKFSEYLQSNGNSCSKAFTGPEYAGLLGYLSGVRRNSGYLESELSTGVGSVSRVILFQPEFLNMDFRKTEKKRLFTQDDYQKLITDCFMKYGEEQHIVVVNPVDDYKRNETTKVFNDYAILADYLVSHSEFSEVEYFSVLLPEVNQLREAYQADYMVLSFIGYARAEKRNSGMLYVFGLVNLETGQFGYVDSKIFRSRRRKYLIKAHIYNSLNQIRK